MTYSVRLADLPGDTRTFICDHVFKATRPIAYVCLDEGDLIVACGHDDHEEDARWHVAGYGHLRARDPSLDTLPPLAAGSGFERMNGAGEWTPLAPETGDEDG